MAGSIFGSQGSPFPFFRKPSSGGINIVTGVEAVATRILYILSYKRANLHATPTWGCLPSCLLPRPRLMLFVMSYKKI